ncbi:MAG: hypothetical protein R3179_03550 [Sedimenticolaceae bacterium]|nr:hypothetical protein [Sedimenticolaceae bacterium]
MSQIDKHIWPTLLLAAGTLLLVAGFVYDLLFAGIPYQDPTPELAASYDRHSAIATVIYWSGILTLLAGLMVMILRFLVRRKR